MGKKAKFNPLRPASEVGGKVSACGSKITVKIDYVNFTFPWSSLEEVDRLVAPYVGEFKERPHGIHTYNKSAVSEIGAILAWSGGRKEALCTLNGKAWDTVPLDHQLPLIQTLISRFGAKFTRLDVAANDYHRFASMDEIHSAADQDNFRGFVLTGIIQNKKRGKVVSDSRTFGRLGKEGAGKFLIIYDKWFESKGAIDCIRYEARYYKEFANLVAQNFAQSSTDEELFKKMGRAVTGVIDFIARAGFEDHIKRAPRLLWWEKIVAELGEGVQVTIPQVIPPLADTMKWVGRSVVPSLQLARIVIEGQGDDFWALLRVAMDESEPDINWRRQATRKLGLDPSELFGVPQEEDMAFNFGWNNAKIAS